MRAEVLVVNGIYECLPVHYQLSFASYTRAGNDAVTGTGQPRFSSANVYHVCAIVIRDEHTPRPTVLYNRRRAANHPL